MLFMPSHMTEERLPQAQFFYDLMATIYPHLLKGLIDKALVQRHKKSLENDKEQTILISDQWMEDLKDLPFTPGKRGRFVHLLKSGAKPVKIKRIKRSREQLDPKEFDELLKKSSKKKIVPVTIPSGN